MKRILIVGSQGQDGRLLGERLLAAGHKVTGIGRADGDILDRSWVAALVERLRPDEVYYLAARHRSSQDPPGTDDAALFHQSLEVHVTGLIHFLDAIKTHAPPSRLFYAASSHVFGRPDTPVQREETPFNPVCIYGITKATGVQCCRFYRNTHGVFAATGLLYNHESPHRNENFVSQKIIRGALAIRHLQQDKLMLGDLSARIDWGYAPDYVDAMTRILAMPEPDDFVIATGETHSVQEFVEAAFRLLGLDWRAHVIENPALITKRKTLLCGDSAKLRALTGWRPTVTFEKMIERLLNAAANPPAGFKAP